MGKLLDKLKFWDDSVNLTAYTSLSTIIENTPLLLNKQKTPWFFKTLSKERQVDPVSNIGRPPATVMGCPGIRDFLNTGIHLRMWSDLIVKIWPDGRFTYMFPESAAPYNIVLSHDDSQFGELYPKDRISIKLVSPWDIVTESPTKFLMTESHYSTSFFRENNLWVPPGVMDFNRQKSTNIHVVCPIKSEPYELFFKLGQPLVTYFPLTEKNIKIEHKLVEPKYTQQFDNLTLSFKNRYYTVVK